LTVRVSERAEKVVAVAAGEAPKRRPRAGAVKKSAPAAKRAPKKAKE
jgi:hypothetical protein